MSDNEDANPSPRKDSGRQGTNNSYFGPYRVEKDENGKTKKIEGELFNVGPVSVGAYRYEQSESKDGEKKHKDKNFESNPNNDNDHDDNVPLSKQQRKAAKMERKMERKERHREYRGNEGGSNTSFGSFGYGVQVGDHPKFWSKE